MLEQEDFTSQDIPQPFTLQEAIAVVEIKVVIMEEEGAMVWCGAYWCGAEVLYTSAL